MRMLVILTGALCLTGLSGLFYHTLHTFACASWVWRRKLTSFCDAALVWPADAPKSPWFVDFYEQGFAQPSLFIDWGQCLASEVAELMAAPMELKDLVLSMVHVATNWQSGFGTEESLLGSIALRALSLQQQVDEIAAFIEGLWIDHDNLNFHLHLFLDAFVRSQVQMEYIHDQAQSSERGPFYRFASYVNIFFHISSLPAPKLTETAIEAKLQSEFEGILKVHCLESSISLDKRIMSILDRDREIRWQSDIKSVLGSLQELETDLRHRRGTQSVMQSLTSHFSSDKSSLDDRFRMVQNLNRKSEQIQTKMLFVLNVTQATRRKITMANLALSSIKLPKDPRDLLSTPLADGQQTTVSKLSAAQPHEVHKAWDPPTHATGSDDHYTYDYRNLASHQEIASRKARFEVTCQTQGHEDVFFPLCAIMAIAEELSVAGSTLTSDKSAVSCSHLPQSVYVVAVSYIAYLNDRDRKGLRHTIARIKAA